MRNGNRATGTRFAFQETKNLVNDAHHYSIRALNPAAHLFEVRLTVAKPDPAGRAFTLLFCETTKNFA
jgi:hypothetical protein